MANSGGGETSRKESPESQRSSPVGRRQTIRTSTPTNVVERPVTDAPVATSSTNRESMLAAKLPVADENYDELSVIGNGELIKIKSISLN